MKNEPVCGFRDAFVAAVVASVREERGVQLLRALVHPIDLEPDLEERLTNILLSYKVRFWLSPYGTKF